MRAKNSLTKKSFLISLAVFVMCFSLAIAIMTIGSNASVGSEIAYAEAENESGGAAAFTLSNDATFASLGLPGNTGATSWSTGNMSPNFYFTTANVSAYMYGSSVGSGKTLNVQEVSSIGVAKAQMSESNNLSAQEYICVTYKPSDTILWLAKNANFNVSCAVSCSVTSYSGGNTVAIYATPGAKTAKEMKNSYSFSSTMSKTVTLDGTNYCISICGYGKDQSNSIFNSDKTWVQLSNLSFKYTITLVQPTNGPANTAYIDDGAAPVVSSSLNSLASTPVSGRAATAAPSGSAQGSTYEPEIKATDNLNKFPVYYSSIENVLSGATDSVVDGSGTLSSYTNKKLGTANGVNYYKYSQVEYVDTYNYINSKSLSANLVDTVSGAVSLDDVKKFMGAGNQLVTSYSEGTIGWGSGNVNYGAGIKAVVVGDRYKDPNTTIEGTSELEGNAAVFDISSSYTTGGKSVYVGGEIVGFAYVRKINQGRVVVMFYAYKNAEVSTEVLDFGGRSVTSTIEFKGIDTTAPTAVPTVDSEDNVTSTSTQLTKWVRSPKLTLEVADNNNEDQETNSPYIWFYTVQYDKNSPNGLGSKLYADYAAIKTAGLQPIAVGELTSFTYYFTSGKAEGIEKGSLINNAIEFGNKTGAGYYRFTFYVCDLAGNLATSVPYSFYVKADYETPTSELSATWTAADSTVHPFTNADNNGYLWSTGEMNISVNLINKNISGNTLVFTELDEAEHTVVFNGDAIIRIDDVNVNATTYTLNNGSSNGVKLNCLIGQPKVVITLSPYNSTGITINFKVPEGALTAWETNFKMYAGTDVTEYDDISANVEEVSFDGFGWTSSIKAYIDNTDPAAPTVKDEEDAGYLISVKDTTEFTLNVTKRNWFTGSSLQLSTIVGFNDSIIGTDFDDRLSVYYGVKQVLRNADFNKLADFVTNSKYKSVDPANYGTYFDIYGSLAGDKLDGDETVADINLRQDLGAGMRMVFVWAMDQAGRVGDIKMYYILADPNTYTIKSSLYNNEILGKTASISHTNADDVVASKFKRGDIINFTFNVDEDYVPYRFTRIDAGTTDILINTTPTIAWSYVNQAAYKSIVTIGESDDSSITITYKLDDPDTLGKLALSDANNIVFEFAHRKIVSYSVTSNSVRYTAKEIVVPMTYEDERSSTHFALAFQGYNGSTQDYEELLVAPTLPSPEGYPYKVKVYIPDNDDTFVTATTSQFMYFTVTKGIVTIKADATTSYYGEDFTLAYTVDGIDADAVEALKLSGDFHGTLALNVEGTYSSLPVGAYAIVEGEAFSVTNYDVTFESSYHTILQKEIVIYVQPNSKEYGALDPLFQYKVDFSQFGTVDRMTNVLGTWASKDGSVYTYQAAKGTIAREAGESAGSYNYSTSASSFPINDNYRLTIRTSGMFTITQRTITLNAGNQTVMFESFNPADVESYEIAPIYYLTDENIKYAGDIKGNLALNNTPASSSGAVAGQYSAQYVYNVNKGTIEDTANLHFEVTGTYTIQTPPSIESYITVLVSLKEGVKLEDVFGNEELNTNVRFAYDTSLFAVTVVGGLVSYNTISWEASIAGFTEGYINAGTYPVIITNAVIKDQNDVDITEKDGKNVVVIVSQFNYYVKPAKIVVAPTATNTEKTYGEDDSTYGIGYAIQSINSKTNVDNGYAGATKQAILDSISGSFARAIYTNENSFIKLGSKYDGASDENGIVLGSTNYYGYAVQVAFSIANTNYEIQSIYSADEKLVINQKAINIKETDFRGINKVYDGTTEVRYGNTKAIDLTALPSNSGNTALLSTDMVEVAFDANYDSPETGNLRNITFSNITLSGAQANNYKLFLVGDTTEEIDADTTITIYYISATSSETIQIKEGIISILRSDYTLSKQYDGTTQLTKAGVQLVNRADDNGSGTSVLYGASNRLVVKEGTYSSKEVSSNYVLNAQFFYPFPTGTDNIEINQTDNSVSVEKVIMDEVPGILVTINGESAAITKRVLNADSFATIAADDRDYNSTSEITFSFTFADGAIADGDEEAAGKANISIIGKTLNDEVDAGENYVVTFTSAKIGSNAFDKHYVVDVESLKKAYSGTNQLYVNINKAKLLPRIAIEDKVYDKTSALTFTDASLISNSELTTIYYQDELANELKLFTYDFSTLDIKLSNKGQEDGNVAYENGEVVKHNVLVNSMTIYEYKEVDSFAAAALYSPTTYYVKKASKVDYEECSATITDQASFEAAQALAEGNAIYIKLTENEKLNNYVIGGYRYDADSDTYKSVGVLTLGQEVQNFEILKYATVNKLELQINTNYINVPEKVYDGTKNSTISISLEGSNVVEEDKALLQVNGKATFSRRQIGPGVAVTVSNISLNVKDQENADLLNNYTLVQFTYKVQRAILAKPITVSVDLGKKDYNGSESVVKSSIKYKYEGLIGADVGSYSINTQNGAYYFNKDVEFDGDGKIVAKNGTVYAPTLVNSREKYINYVLSTKFEAYTYNKVNTGASYDALTEYFDETHKLIEVEEENFAALIANGLYTRSSNGAAPAGYFAYELENGTFYYETTLPSTTFDTVVAYYYYLPTTSEYIIVKNTDGSSKFKSAANKDELEAAIQALINSKQIIGYYEISGVGGVYFVQSGFSWAANAIFASYKGVLADDKTLTYLSDAKGIVNQRKIAISSVQQKLTTNFEKTYDGTTKFYGVKDVDYAYDKSSIINVIAGDDIELVDVTAKFDQASTYAIYVVFTTSGIGGTDSSNYVAGNATSTNMVGKINKLPIYALLKDSNMLYGTNLGSVAADIEYSLKADGSGQIARDGNNMYVGYYEFLKHVGLMDNSGVIAPEDEPYVAELDSMLYKKSESTYVKLTEDELATVDKSKIFMRLAGTFTFPTTSVSFSEKTPAAGATSVEYTLKGGSSTNFEFTYVYTDDVNNTSKLTVVKKDLLVVGNAPDSGFSRRYGENDPTVSVTYVDTQGKTAIISGETWRNIFTDDTIPTVEFRIYNTNTSEEDATKIGADAKINDTVEYTTLANELITNTGLDAGLYYVAHINDKGATSANYEIHYPTIVYKDGTFKYKFVIGGRTVEFDCAQLTITLPSLDASIYVNEANKEVVYNSLDQTECVISGDKLTDAITIGGEKAKNVKIVDGNVVPYSGKVDVVRAISAGDNDTNGYKLYWISKDEVKLTVKKALPGLTVYKDTVVYGKTGGTYQQTYSLDQIKVANVYNDIPYNKEKDFKIEYYKVNDDKTETYLGESLNGATKGTFPENAGEYKVYVTLITPNTNYENETQAAAFVISPATLTVSIITTLEQEYDEDTVYSINYSVNDDNGINLSKADTECIFYKNVAGKEQQIEVDGPGRYQFRIALKSSVFSQYGNNVALVNNLGHLDLMVKQLTTYSDDEKFIAQLSMKDNQTILADTLISRYVYQTNTLVEDDLYWTSVSQFMTVIANECGTDAKLDLIVKLGLKYGSNTQALNGDLAEIKVVLPDTVSKDLDGYVVYSVTENGGLVRLSNYTLADGNLTYSTDYLGSLVFVKLGEEGLSTHYIVLIACCVSAAVVIIVLGIVATILKKKKLAKMLEE